VVFDIIHWNIHNEDAAAALLRRLLLKLGLGQIFSEQRVGVELTVSWVRTDRPCGSCANRILSYFGCHVICSRALLGNYLGFLPVLPLSWANPPCAHSNHYVTDSHAQRGKILLTECYWQVPWCHRRKPIYGWRIICLTIYCDNTSSAWIIDGRTPMPTAAAATDRQMRRPRRH